MWSEKWYLFEIIVHYGRFPFDRWVGNIGHNLHLWDFWLPTNIWLVVLVRGHTDP